MATNAGILVLSPYANALENTAKDRYEEKISSVGLDPYLVSSVDAKALLDCALKELPDLEHCDISHYLIHTTGGFNRQALKAYKSMDAYTYFVSGWVREILVCLCANKFIIKSKVLHSQKLSEKPLNPWVIIEKDGQVLCAHCDCMAGLGEACSHIAATLFAVDSVVRSKKETTCTSLPNTWLPPSAKRQANVVPSTGADIDFSNAKRRYQCLSDEKQKSRKSTKVGINPTKEEESQFFADLEDAGPKSAILAAVPGFSAAFERSASVNLPAPLTDLYHIDHSTLPYLELIDKCQEAFVSLSVSPDEATAIEAETRTQSNNKMWFRQRAGRLTASKFKAAMRTDVANPSQSLIKAICYPEEHKFSTKATRWGCKHEKTARAVYTAHMRQIHTDFSINDAGFIVNSLYPHLGASPDGIVNCKCCGEGVIEIKCPYCLESTNINLLADKKTFCLKKNDSGVMQLKDDHAYFYQVQAQLHLAEKKYCDFVVWGSEVIHIQRIQPNFLFWNDCIQQSSEFYIHGILPELLAKWYTRNPQVEIVDKTMDLSNTWCYCRRIAEPGMVMIECKSGNCKINKFHLDCLKLQNVPKRKWLCPDCRVLAKACKK